MSSLNLSNNNVVECDSTSLIQKAHELHKVRKVSSAASNRVLEERTPEKKIINAPISLADRAARIHNDLPEIEEMADKENDTFAQGGPLKGLNLIRNKSSKKVDQKSNERLQLHSAQSHEKYRMYRDPSDKDSVGIANLARDQLQSKNRPSLNQELKSKDVVTPGLPPSKALDLYGAGVKLPRIQSSRQSHVNSPTKFAGNKYLTSEQSRAQVAQRGPLSSQR